MLPAFDVIRPGVRDQCRADARSTQPVQRIENGPLDLNKSKFEASLPACDCGEDSLLIHRRVQRMCHTTHGFHSIVDMSKAPAEHVVVVVKTMPVFSRDAEDLGDWYLAGGSG